MEPEAPQRSLIRANEAFYDALEKRRLDAIDGTAVLDVKPYLAEYDAFPGARRPG